MKTNLKLVVNTREVSDINSEVANSNLEFKVRDLVPSRHQVSEVVVRQKVSNVWLAAVVLAHMLGMIWMVNAPATLPTPKPSLPPMMVSLVSNPAPEPEVVPLLPTPPKPVIKKQKLIVKETPMRQEPVAVSEAPPAQPAPTVEAKAPAVTEVAQVKPEPEPVIEPPRFGAAYLNNPAPNYPLAARRQGEQGRVLLRVLVSSNGDAETVVLEDSSGSSKLDEAAIQAVKKWRFIPAKRSNQPISAYVLVPVKFSLES